MKFFFKKMLKISVVYLEKQKCFIPKRYELSQEWTGFNIKTTICLLTKFSAMVLVHTTIFLTHSTKYLWFASEVHDSTHLSILPILWLFVFLVLCFFNFMCFGKFPGNLREKSDFQAIIDFGGPEKVINFLGSSGC